MTGPFTWDPVTLRYRDAFGRFVSRAAVRAALDYAIQNAERRLLALGEDLRFGRITLTAWRAETAANLQALHLYSAAAARGGWGQMTHADFGRVGQILRQQYTYLNTFTREIVAGAQSLDGRFTNRVKLYAQSGRVTYHAIDAAVNADAGMTERRSLLSNAEHCNDCLDMAALGWVALDDPDYIPLGQRQCLSNDKCSEEFRAAEVLA